MSVLIITLNMLFNFQSITVKDNIVITTSNNKTFTSCQFEINDTLVNDIAETQGECFNEALTGVF